jgi:hypothetical protein
MFVNKIGFDHIEFGINNQDFGLDEPKLGIKCVVDGCSEGKHSEVGAKLFCALLEEQNFTVDQVFDQLIKFFGTEPQTIHNYLCFTTLIVTENEDSFQVMYCGDGYIIKEKHDGTIEFEKIDDGECPKYYVYNYVEPKYLKTYKDGVDFTIVTYPKSEYKTIGVASDGLRYVFGKDYEDEFIRLLKERRMAGIKRLINREHKHFKDDITIAF